MSKIFEQLLRVRNIDAQFLHPKYEECIDPDLMPDMGVAIERLKRARDGHEKVLIYGDYDVDGVTSSVVMRETLKLAGIEVVEIMLPNRFLDGYGMSEKVVVRAQELGVKLVVTVDCGSRNQEIIDKLLEIGVETIVTDHHECGWGASDSASAAPSHDMVKPAAVAIVNPKRKDVEVQEELRELAGVGVAFKLAQGMVKAGMIPEGQEKWLLDLVLIGTVCDSMRLVGENRRLCYYGMLVLGKTRRQGLRELMHTAGVKKMNGEAIGFQLGPRLNAAGRMETAERALELLLAETKTVAARLAQVLEELNLQRKSQQLAAVEEIRERGVGEDKVIVATGDWHEGVLGIVAGRLVEEYHRPAFALAEVDEAFKGSGRSFGGFNLAEALTVCDKYIIGGGGHAEACGVKVAKDQIERFTGAINAYYEGLDLQDQEKCFDVMEDLAVEEFEELSLELLKELEKLEPYGPGNMEPVFLLPEVRVIEAAKLGKEERHLRLTVWDKQGKSLKLMRFYAPEQDLRLKGGETVNVWITLAENDFRGLRSVEGRILRLAVC